MEKITSKFKLVELKIDSSNVVVNKKYFFGDIIELRNKFIEDITIVTGQSCPMYPENFGRHILSWGFVKFNLVDKNTGDVFMDNVAGQMMTDVYSISPLVKINRNVDFEKSFVITTTTSTHPLVLPLLIKYRDEPSLPDTNGKSFKRYGYYQRDILVKEANWKKFYFKDDRFLVNKKITGIFAETSGLSLEYGLPYTRPEFSCLSLKKGNDFVFENMPLAYLCRTTSGIRITEFDPFEFDPANSYVFVPNQLQSVTQPTNMVFSFIFQYEIE